MPKNLQTVSDELKVRVEQKVLECIKKIEKLTNHEFEMPHITYECRGKVAGTACSYTNTIDLNPIIFNENVEDFLARTVVHEFAHIADDIMHPWNKQPTRGRKKRQSHGRTWKWIMIQLGADPSRTHSYDVTNATVRRKNKYRYRCKCCGADVVLGPIKHKKQQAKDAEYRHTRCRRKLRHAGYVGGEIELVEHLGQVTYQEAHAQMKKPEPKKRAPRADSKIDKAVKICKIYMSLGTLVSAREEIIECMMDELDMSKAGATTYYYNAKKRL